MLILHYNYYYKWHSVKTTNFFVNKSISLNQLNFFFIARAECCIHVTFVKILQAGAEFIGYIRLIAYSINWKFNERPQKRWSTKFHENRLVSKILCPPHRVRHLKFRKSDVKFIISDLKSLWVQSFAEFMWISKFHVRHIGYPPFCEGYGYLRSVRPFFLAVQPFRSPLIIVRIES